MERYKLSPRKPDLLDELEALRKRRGIAYRADDLVALEVIHQEMKVFWLRNGWTEEDAQEQYEIHVQECKVPFQANACGPNGGRLILMRQFR